MKKTPSISRFRRSFRRFACALVFGALAGHASAQNTTNAQVLIVDTDRLFSESQLGAEKAREFEQAFRALAAENKDIEGKLIAEEKELTELRASLTADEFKQRADAFDAQVERLRTEQDEKERALSRAREEARNELFTDFTAIIAEILRERGAMVVIDRRNVYISVGGIDITDETLDRYNRISGIADQ